jgi:post-segregation antitoxin (ccd killing protein)
MKPKPKTTKESIKVSVEKGIARSAYAVTRATGITMSELVEDGLEHSLKKVRDGQWRPRTAPTDDDGIG